jgi:AcrR family transcriptional regulator
MPSTVNKDKKRLAIIHAAAEMFARTGYHESTIQQIADQAAIGKGTVYEYFRTKEDLFLAVYNEWMSNYEHIIRERVACAPDALSKVDAIRESAVEFYQQRAAQAPLLLEFWAHALRTDNPAFLERINATRRFLQELGETLTKELTAAGWFTEVHAETFSLLESSISDGIFLTWVLEGQRFPLEKAFTFRQSLIGLGLLAPESRALLQPRLASKLIRGMSEQN